jgi:hypothetical protein
MAISHSAHMLSKILDSGQPGAVMTEATFEFYMLIAHNQLMFMSTCSIRLQETWSC